MDRRAREALVQAAMEAAIDSGKIIELGWLSLRAQTIPPDAPQVHLDAMRGAFFAGAQHLFASIMNTLDPDHEPTEHDMRRMDGIDKELRAFIDAYVLKHTPPQGEA